MRGNQLAALITPFLSDNLRVRVVSFHAGLLRPTMIRTLALSVPRGSVIVFVKSAAKGLTQEHLAPLRKRGARIGLDCIDTPLDEIDFDLFDFFVSASLAGKTALKDRLELLGKNDLPVELLHHHFDPILGDMCVATDRAFSCGYVGEPKNALIPQSIADQVEHVNILYARDFRKSLARISSFTLHYGVRPLSGPSSVGTRQFKPFTKGFTAAACASNILVNREVDDAVALLGDNYPFLVSAQDPVSVVDGLEKARLSYGGPVWREGLDRMRALKELVAPPVLAARIQEIVAAVTP